MLQVVAAAVVAPEAGLGAGGAPGPAQHLGAEARHRRRPEGVHERQAHGDVAPAQLVPVRDEARRLLQDSAQVVQLEIRECAQTAPRTSAGLAEPVINASRFESIVYVLVRDTVCSVKPKFDIQVSGIMLCEMAPK